MYTNRNSICVHENIPLIGSLSFFLFLLLFSVARHTFRKLLTTTTKCQIRNKYSFNHLVIRNVHKSNKIRCIGHFRFYCYRSMLFFFQVHWHHFDAIEHTEPKSVLNASDNKCSSKSENDFGCAFWSCCRRDSHRRYLDAFSSVKNALVFSKTYRCSKNRSLLQIPWILWNICANRRNLLFAEKCI